MASYADAEPIRQAAARRAMRGLSAETAVWLTGVAHIRHHHTDYDALMDDGYGRDAARFFVVDDINACLADWRCPRRLESAEQLAEIDDELAEATFDQINRSDGS